VTEGYSSVTIMNGLTLDGSIEIGGADGSYSSPDGQVDFQGAPAIPQAKMVSLHHFAGLEDRVETISAAAPHRNRAEDRARHEEPVAVPV
jgi:hypothetical protein